MDISMPISAPAAGKSPQLKRASLASVYGVFFVLGSLSFGGGSTSWVYRAVVEKAGWLTEEEFLTCTALTYNVPGIRAANMAVYVGHSVRGLSGAVVALLALITGPFFAVIGLAACYEIFNRVPGFALMMAGIAAAAVGLMIRTGLVAGRTCARQLMPATIMMATFLAVGVARFPVVQVLLVLAPLSIFAAVRSRGR